jgi:short-subunit dehydrogenase involved in D-alanine esterification of teichoic acids
MENFMSGIEDKVVVITGASSGIGEATALLLAERGGKVVLGARGADRLEALAARIADAGGDAAYARTDVRRRGDLSDLVKLACERYGKLDVLVHNAGVMPISPLDDLRVTIISPGFVRTNFAEGVTSPGTSSRCHRMRSPARLRSRSSSRPMLM